MISGTHTVEIDASPERLWTYLSTFDNWAEYVVGFQKFTVVDERTSVWTLRGDVGILAREVQLEVVRLEQDPGSRASYSITGITERIDGTGTFEIARRGASDDSGSAAAVSPTEVARVGWWRRLVRRWALGTVRRQQARNGERPAASGSGIGSGPPPVGDDERGQDLDGALLTFTLEVTPGGPMAPVVEMLMRPLVEPAAADFSARVRAQLEGTTHA